MSTTTTTYPRVINVGLDCCKNTVSAELAIRRQQSLILSVKDFIPKIIQSTVITHQPHQASAPGYSPSAPAEGPPIYNETRHESIKYGSLSLEGRHYFEANNHSGGFLSARIGTSGNIGLALGAKIGNVASQVFSASIRVGASGNVFTRQIKPVCGLAVEFNI